MFVWFGSRCSVLFKTVSRSPGRRQTHYVAEDVPQVTFFPVTHFYESQLITHTWHYKQSLREINHNCTFGRHCPFLPTKGAHFLLLGPRRQMSAFLCPWFIISRVLGLCVSFLQFFEDPPSLPGSLPPLQNSVSGRSPNATTDPCPLQLEPLATPPW